MTPSMQSCDAKRKPSHKDVLPHSHPHAQRAMLRQQTSDSTLSSARLQLCAHSSRGACAVEAHGPRAQATCTGHVGRSLSQPRGSITSSVPPPQQPPPFFFLPAGATAAAFPLSTSASGGSPGTASV
mmetsp:Transcript_66505/g.148453  ORF Transcript_66505/g.148453 Transcript_66505/m.148453 type:complete len:127 (+) Transcript_66505:429-809(+)